MGTLSPRWVLRPGAVGARTLPASWLQTAVAGSGWALKGSPPGGALSAEQKSSCLARSIQQCAAPCCRPRPSYTQLQLEQALHEVPALVGEGSRLRPPTPPLAPSLILSPRPSLPTMLVSWHRQEVIHMSLTERQAQRVEVVCPAELGFQLSRATPEQSLSQALPTSHGGGGTVRSVPLGLSVHRTG